jgi:asparagine synthase (glutamine-hydrolysing)
MCGFTFSSDPHEYGSTLKALERLKHRGPDGQGIHRDPRSGATLAHRRLAIMDPSNGAQPILENSGETALVANGMIYNYRDLRHDLSAADGSSGFITQGDSEAILKGYLAYGPAIASRLDGMFTYVISDGAMVTAARDPIGIKPLYLGRSSSALFLASEIKALLGVADEIEEFPPGHIFRADLGLEAYYAIPDEEPTIEDPAEAAALIRKTLESAVMKRLQTDVPLGAFLSGGLDSSIIAALAIRELGSLETFSVGLEGSDDLAAARRVARHLGSDHHERILTKREVEEALPRILYHLESFDRDLVRSAVPCWFVSEVASRSVKVTLTGEGADELFAGYGYYKDYGPSDALQEELRRSISIMHNINLQRVDRMTMAHGLEARVPFLDTDMIALAADIAPSLKLKTTDGTFVEKWILRKAFEDLLPDDIVWRDKAQFDEGSGIADLLNRSVPQSHATSESPRRSGNHGRSAADQAYRDLLASSFDEPGPLLDLVAHWSTGRASIHKQPERTTLRREKPIGFRHERIRQEKLRSHL